MGAITDWWNRRYNWQKVLMIVAVVFVAATVALVLFRGGGGTPSVYSVEATGASESIFLTEGADPAFAHDGNRIAVTAEVEESVSSIYIVDLTSEESTFVTNGDDPAWYKLPEDRALAAQYLLLYEMSLPFGLDLNNQVNVDKSVQAAEGGQP